MHGEKDLNWVTQENTPAKPERTAKKGIPKHRISPSHQ